MHIRFLALCAIATGLCVWSGEIRAQGGAEADRAALEAVYRATGGDDWTENDNWLSAAPVGDWYGVETNEQGRVIGLRLGGWVESEERHVGNGLTGSLPAELGTLSRLRWLEIAGNRGLTGRIPGALGNLTELEWVSLQANWLTGAIPPALGGLSNLEWLALDQNVLTGSIPTELGNLVGLDGLSLYGNLLSGRVPAELGSLTKLLDLDLGGNELSGPLPSTVTRLSSLRRLQLEGSGLCVPDTAAARAWLATIRDFMGLVCDGASSLAFERVVTLTGLGGMFDEVVAVADLDGDGREDVVTASYPGEAEEPSARLTKAPLRVLVNVGDGSFRHAPELVAGTIGVHSPFVVADDFNSDGQVDLAVFDAGVYVPESGGYYGNPPQLYLSSPDGRLRSSEALADAVRREHELRPPEPTYSGPADLHVKTAASGDIDGDGDIDLWVESSGGANVISHFMVNNGDGTFTIDSERAPYELLHNPPPEFWRHVGNALVDLDNDGDLDLALGQIRDLHHTHVNQFSIVLVNDGSGHYPARIELPHPAFYEGYTSVQRLTHFDVNRDGLQDLLLLHSRNDETFPNVIYFTGRYIQVLINRGGTSFDDETAARMGDQSATTPERDPDGEPLHNAATPRMHDVDGDGCADLVMWGNPNVRTESPLVYVNDGNGRFQAASPVPFAGSDHYLGPVVPADVNGDAAIDFVVPQRHAGPDGLYSTADDVAMLVTLLNTTPAGPIRCRPPVTTMGTLPARTLYVGAGAVAVVVPVADAFRQASTYRASSSAPGIATVSLSGSNLTVTPVASGEAIITVTATGADNSAATQRFRVTVLAAPATTTFNDRLVPGATPLRALHFLALRTRIAGLRTREGLPPVRWTDPVLTVGVTPVKRVHLTELRAALDAVYDAAQRPRPTYTDSIVTAGMTAIKTVHVEELRHAILALE